MQRSREQSKGLSYQATRDATFGRSGQARTTGLTEVEIEGEMEVIELLARMIECSRVAGERGSIKVSLRFFAYGGWSEEGRREGTRGR
jgi:hypothetical protein